MADTPVFGRTRVDNVTSGDVLKALQPIWLEKPETARRVAQRIRTVMDWAKAAGHTTGENPVDGALPGLPRQPERNRHHRALPYTDVPDFVQRLRNEEGGLEIPRLAFEFLILTAARTSEILEAEWPEFDLDEKTWTVPAERMKAKRPHRVPLPSRAIAILERARAVTGASPYVFPSSDPEKPLSNMVFLMALRRLKVDATAHGFRSSFRDWASETTGFPRDVCEAALAHLLKDKTEAAYRRGDLFEKRRKLMDAWADFLIARSSKVVRLELREA